MNLTPKEMPQLSEGQHTVHVTSMYLTDNGNRVLVNFAEECNPASFPVQDILDADGTVVFAGADGIARLQDFMHKAHIGATSLNPGASTPASGKIQGSYVLKNGYYNWSLVAWKEVD